MGRQTLKCAIPFSAFVSLLLLAPGLTLAQQAQVTFNPASGPPGTNVSPTATPTLALSPGLATSATTVYRVRPDLRLCPSPLCGGAFASLVNQTTTRCVDGEDREACYVALLDFSALGLTDTELSLFRSALFAGHALLEGWIDERQFENFGPLGELHGRQGWRAATDAMPQGTVYGARDNGVRCLVAPCFSYDVTAVNSPQHLTVSDVDLSKVGATTEQLDAARQALSTAALLIAGTIQLQPNAGPAGDGQILVATQFYLPAAAAPVSSTPTASPRATSTPPASGTPPGPGIGGKGIGISPSSGGARLSWQPGAGQTGYRVARLARGTVTWLPERGPLGMGETSFADSTAPSGANCYFLLPLGTASPVSSDLLCAIVELQTLTGSPQNFTLRLNQSSTASLSWTEPPGGGQDGYLLVALGGSTQSLGGAVTNAGVPMSGPTCYLLGAIRSGALMDNTGVVCGLPGFSNLGS